MERIELLSISVIRRFEAEIETINTGLVSPNFQEDSYDETRTYH